MNFVATPVDNYPAGNITSYLTLVQSTPVEAETTTNPTSTPTPTATSTPTSTATETPTQTPDQNSQDYTLIILAVVVLAVVIGIAAVLFTRGKRGKTQQAPPAQ
jgi:hypothetical protein